MTRSRSENETLGRDFAADKTGGCTAKLQCHKATAADGIVRELKHYGMEIMVAMIVMRYSSVGGCGRTSTHRDAGEKVGKSICFDKGDRSEPGYDRGIAVLNVKGKAFASFKTTESLGIGK